METTTIPLDTIVEEEKRDYLLELKDQIQKFQDLDQDIEGLTPEEKKKHEKKRKLLQKKIQRQVKVLRTFVEIRRRELEIERMHFDALLGRVAKKKKEYEKQEFLDNLERYLNLLFIEEVKKQWISFGFPEEDWLEFEKQLFGEEDPVFAHDSEATRAWLDLRKKARDLQQEIVEMRKIFGEIYDNGMSEEELAERINLFLLKSHQFSMEELKRLYISLFQNAEEKAIAEIMFDEMTQEEKLQLFNILFERRRNSHRSNPDEGKRFRSHFKKGKGGEDDEEGNDMFHFDFRGKSPQEIEREKARLLELFMNEAEAHKNGQGSSAFANLIELALRLHGALKSGKPGSEDPNHPSAADIMFGDDMGTTSNPLFQRRRGSLTGDNDGLSDDDGSDEEGGKKGLSRAKTIRHLEKEFDKNLDQFLDNKGSSKFGNSTIRFLSDFRDQFSKAKKKNKKGQKDKDSLDDIAQHMFEDGVEGDKNKLFERRKASMRRAGDKSESDDSGPDGSDDENNQNGTKKNHTKAKPGDKNYDENLDEFMGNKSSKYGMPNLRGLVDMKDGKKKKNSKSKPGDDADDIAQFMFDGDMENPNKLFERRKASMRRAGDKSESDISLSDDSDEENNLKNEPTKKGHSKPGAKNYDDNLDEFMGQTSKNGGPNIRGQLMDMKDQLKDKKKKQKSNLKKGDTEEDIAQFMFSDQEEEGAAATNKLFEGRKGSIRRNLDSSSESDDDSDSDMDEETKKMSDLTKANTKKNSSKTSHSRHPKNKKSKKRSKGAYVDEDDWESKLDDFVQNKSSTVSHLIEMIPAQRWDEFKERTRNFRKRNEDIQKIAKEEFADPEQFMYQDDFKAIPLFENNLFERRKKSIRYVLPSKDDDVSSDDSVDEDAAPKSQLGRAKSVKISMKPNNEIRELEQNLDNFMANVSSDSFGINAQTWDVFKNKVQNLRQQTNHVRDIMEEEKGVVHEFVVHSVKKEKDAKKRVSNSPQTKRRNKQSIPTFESPQEKKKEPISKSVSSEGLSTRMTPKALLDTKIQEVEEQLQIEEQSNSKFKRKSDNKKISTLKSSLSNLQILARDIKMSEEEIQEREKEIEREIENQTRIQSGLTNLLLVAQGTQKKSAQVELKACNLKIQNLEEEKKLLQYRKTDN